MTKRPPKPAKKVPPRKFASGGSTSRTSASKRGDGCATKVIQKVICDETLQRYGCCKP
jgi:hypothetical protein